MHLLQGRTLLCKTTAQVAVLNVYINVCGRHVSLSSEGKLNNLKTSWDSLLCDIGLLSRGLKLKTT